MTEQLSNLGDSFDRTLRGLRGLPDVVETKPSTVTVLTPVIDLAETWIVQTFRQTDRGDDHTGSRDVIFVQSVSGKGSIRLVLPPEVADTIARQRDSLVTKNRKKGARQAVATRRARGK